jgi:hypothetical protein
MQGWPYKLFMPFSNSPRMSPISVSVDHLFTMNEGHDFMNYSNHLVKTRQMDYQPHYYLHLQSFVARTIYSYNFDWNQSKTFLMEILRMLPEKERSNFWSLRHGVVSSTPSNVTHVHNKVDFIGLMVLFSSNLTVANLKELLSLFDEDTKQTMQSFDIIKPIDEVKRIYFFNRRIVKLLTSTCTLLLQFSDKVRLFKIIYERLERFCNMLDLPVSYLFRAKVISVDVHHMVNTQNDLTVEKLDILTFCAYFGRAGMLKYLLKKLQDELRKGYVFESFADRSTTEGRKVQTELFEYMYATSNPFEHLLYTCIIRGNVKCFCHVFNMLDEKTIEAIDWRNLMIATVQLVKLDATKYSEVEELLNRKRNILKKIFKSRRLKPVAHNLANGIDKCIMYLTSFRKTLTKVNDFFTFYKPHYKTRSRVLLRSELIIWGTHIYKCFCLFEETTDEIYEFNI